MTTERLRERIITELREWIEPEDEGIFCQIAERILALLPGPVMPEVPSDEVLKPLRGWLGGYRAADFLYGATRDALIAEQKEHR